MFIPADEFQLVNVPTARDDTGVLPDELHQIAKVVLRHDEQTEIGMLCLEGFCFAQLIQHDPVEAHIGTLGGNVARPLAVPADQCTVHALWLHGELIGRPMCLAAGAVAHRRHGCRETSVARWRLDQRTHR